MVLLSSLNMNLTEAIKIHKYGDLNKWGDLFSYQRRCNDPEQVRQIGEWARRFNKGEAIYLPLRLNVTQKQVPLPKPPKTGDETVDLVTEVFF